MKYVKKNVNPKDIKGVDCVVRAIAFATEKRWEVVYDNLCAIGKLLCRMPNDKEVYTALLSNFDLTKPKITKGCVRPKVKDFTDGTYVLSIARHLTVVKNGTLYDLWDCRGSAVYCYWRIK